MLDTRGYGKVCDMGLARFVVGKTNTQVPAINTTWMCLALTLHGFAWLSVFVCVCHVCCEAGTPDYMAPEMIDPPHYHDNSADWWSLGVLMFVPLAAELLDFKEDFQTCTMSRIGEKLRRCCANN